MRTSVKLSEFCKLHDFTFGSLKLAILGMFIPWKLANTINLCVLYFQVGLRAGRILISYVWEWGRWAGAPLLLSLHLCIDSFILPRDYGDRGWIGAHRIILMIVNLFNIIVCILQNPTLNPLNLVVSGWKLMDPSELNYSDLQIPPGDKK